MFVSRVVSLCSISFKNKKDLCTKISTRPIRESARIRPAQTQEKFSAPHHDERWGTVTFATASSSELAELCEGEGECGCG